VGGGGGVGRCVMASRGGGFNDCSIVTTVVGNIPFHKREKMSL